MHMPNIAMVIFPILACVELRECDVMEKLTRPHEIPMNLIHEFNRLSKPFKKTKREFMAYIFGRIDNSSAEPSGERLRATHLYVPQQDSTGTEVWQTGEDAVELLATQEKNKHCHHRMDTFAPGFPSFSQFCGPAHAMSPARNATVVSRYSR